MDAIVLAGGFATRMWPITRRRPKMLLPVGETTVIDRILQQLEDDDRIDTVYLSTNEAFAETFREHLADRGYDKTQLSVEDTADEDEKFGVVGALSQLVDREDVDDDLFVIAGDNLIGFDLGEFLDEFEANGTPTLAAYDVGSREKAKSYGLVELDGSRVIDFQEKPDEPNSTLVSIACYAFPADSVRFAEYLAGDNNPDEPGWYIDWLQSNEPVHAFTFDDVWFDIGSADSYLDTVEWKLDGGSMVDPDATVENCEIGETVHVMAGATVRDSTLERTLVFPDATVENCNVDETILDTGTEVEDLRISQSLISDISVMDEDT
ncbi:sugar phosphate nucleotidyltransferase [Natranaeroarchaeum aerophilus]|uniref:NTP transferase domain-containing protein n=1 Tax=Natranaeroarchaeum aerophilus TaxID=2917711 RepID=A0AAE3K6F7_9EURY|nr:sugar phosphate nucleotidyltransferase [Natranaeroarchaeum aerophilus]MCL9815172.1 NTP transferase domain-containing protein [Natranaeroarchaeum aerophilus]